MLRTKTIAYINLLAVLLVIFANYYLNAVGVNGENMATISAKYDNLFTPAGYAFSIWGLIFLGVVAQGIFLVIRAHRPEKDQTFTHQIGLWMALANGLNIAWVLCWLHLYTGWSVVVMLALLSTLIILIRRLNMERWDAPLKTIAFIWWPICLYSGWIAVATIANIAAWLTKIGFTGGPLKEDSWALIMIGVATVLGLLMIRLRNMREFAGVVVWALVAIAVRHWGTMPVLQYAALGGSAILIVTSMIHAYNRRDTLPHKKGV